MIQLEAGTYVLPAIPSPYRLDLPSWTSLKGAGSLSTSIVLTGSQAPTLSGTGNEISGLSLKSQGVSIHPYLRINAKVSGKMTIRDVSITPFGGESLIVDGNVTLAIYNSVIPRMSVAIAQDPLSVRIVGSEIGRLAFRAGPNPLLSLACIGAYNAAGTVYSNTCQ